MKHHIQICGSILVTLLMFTHLAYVQARQSPQSAPSVRTEWGDSSLFFVENVGQFDASVRYQVSGSSETLWLTDDAIWLTLSQPMTPTTPSDDSLDSSRPHHPRHQAHVKVRFGGAANAMQLVPLRQQAVSMNYYQSNDAATNWHTNVPVWGGIRYEHVYPGVDLEISGREGHIVWRLVCHTACHPETMHLHIEGVTDVDIGVDTLTMTTEVRTVALPLLAGYNASQAHITDVRADVPYRVDSQTWDVPLTIATHTEAEQPSSSVASVSHPSLIFSSLLGGEHAEYLTDMALDAQGNMYVVGETTSPTFPTKPGLTSTSSKVQGFITKLSADGKNLLYSTLFSASPEALAVDANGTVYVGGATSNPQMPVTPGAFDTTYNGGGQIGTGEMPDGTYGPIYCHDAFLAKLNPQGYLTYSTFLGGKTLPYGAQGGCETVHALAVDAHGVMYATGYTTSADFPTTRGAYKRVFANEEWALNDDVFVVKLNPAGTGTSDLLYSTFVGGAWEEHGNDIAVDSSGIIYVVGYHAFKAMLPESPFDFPTTPRAYDPGPLTVHDDYDGFIFQLNPAGRGTSDLLYSTLLGPDYSRDQGTGNDKATSLVLDDAGHVYVAGTTNAPRFPTTPGAFDTTCGTDGTCNTRSSGTPDDFFVAKLTLAGQGPADLRYATFVGGDSLEEDPHLARDSQGDIYLTGTSWSDTGFPTTQRAFQTTRSYGYKDACVVRLRLNSQGTQDLIYGSFLGGYSDDGAFQGSAGNSIAVTEPGVAVIAGETDTPGFPTTPGAYDTTFGRGDCRSSEAFSYCTDVFLSKMRLETPYTITGRIIRDSSIVSATVSANQNQVVHDFSTESYTLDVAPGSYTVQLHVSESYADCLVSPASYNVTVPPDATGKDFTIQCTFDLHGRVVDGLGQPMRSTSLFAPKDVVLHSLSGPAYASLDAHGYYTFTQQAAGAYALQPDTAQYYLWSPLHLWGPPDQTNQTLTLSTIAIESQATPPLQDGDTISYTLTILHPPDSEPLLIAPIPAQTTYVSGSLHTTLPVTRATISYDAAQNALTGKVYAPDKLKVTYAVQVNTSSSSLATIISNQAQLCTQESDTGNKCEASNTVQVSLQGSMVYLPMITKAGTSRAAIVLPTSTPLPSPTATPAAVLTPQAHAWGRTNYVGRSPIDIAVGGDGHMYVAPSNARLQQSIDGGLTWQTPDEWPLSIQHVLPYGSMPQLVYTSDFRTVYQTIDEGLSWKYMGVLPDETTIAHLVLAPSAPTTLYAATTTDNKLYKSTNGGTIWTPLSSLDPITSSIKRVMVHPNDAARVYVLAPTTLSTSSDAGAKWHTVPTTMTSVALHPITPTMLYGASGCKFFTSTDGGTHWDMLHTSVYEPTICAIDEMIVDPTDPKRLYASQNDSTPAVYRSRDGGMTWTELKTGWPGNKATHLVFYPEKRLLYATTGDSNDSVGTVLVYWDTDP